jgi:hypothetical protein
LQSSYPPAPKKHDLISELSSGQIPDLQLLSAEQSALLVQLEQPAGGSSSSTPPMRFLISILVNCFILYILF